MIIGMKLEDSDEIETMDELHDLIQDYQTQLISKMEYLHQSRPDDFSQDVMMELVAEVLSLPYETHTTYTIIG